MFNFTTLKKYDVSGMYKVYDQWPNITRESYSSSQDIVDFDKKNHIVFAGMEGSG